MGGSWKRRLIAVIATLLAAALSSSGRVDAIGNFGGPERATSELRLAVALSPERTSVWVQARIAGNADAVPYAIVIPVVDGTAVDWGHDAWLEALEMASAPRILPPSDNADTCPGVDLEHAVEVVGDLGHATLAPALDVTVAVDGDALASWAAGHDLSVEPAMQDALAALAMTGHRFVAALFVGAAEPTWTPTIRVVAPTADAALPLSLTRARGQDLDITLWTIAEGRTSIDGYDEVTIDGGDVVFDAASASSNYVEQRDDLLWSADATTLIEASSRAALLYELRAGATTVEPVTTSFITRAALYDNLDLTACDLTARTTLQSQGQLSTVCPPGALGHVGAEWPCDETLSPGQLDATTLRCIAEADDLALAVSGMHTSLLNLTRHRMLLPAGMAAHPGTFEIEGSSQNVFPVITAGRADTSSCDDEPPTTATPPSDGGGSGKVRVPVYEVHSSCGNHHVGEVLYYAIETADAAPSAYYVDNSDCGGGTTASYEAPVESVDVDVSVDAEAGGDDCGGESPDGYDNGEDCGGESPDGYDGGEDCSGETGSGDSCGGDSAGGGEDCGGDSAGDADCGGDAGGGADCGGDVGGGADCGGDCTIASQKGGRRRRMPRLSILIMLMLCIAVPLRRFTRPRRSAPSSAIRRFAAAVRSWWLSLRAQRRRLSSGAAANSESRR